MTYKGYAARIEYSELMLRVPPEVHPRAAMMAEAHGMSINQWDADVLSKAL
jgi:predicted HicB family RNase H-like nuclease